ncbi:OB-fold nucleic acid binding domain-containing protein [Pyrococcus kukulkanii]|uniref:OB-fold nucleic acid binding domain-containing protein n=1 Tax=Pyrococcus kukulkanii TaxID=1609559 RepID=A0ABV4T5N9_9EURY
MKKRMPYTPTLAVILQEGFLVKSEEEFAPNYILTRDAQRIYRAKLVGTVIRKRQVDAEIPIVSMWIDDGTYTIQVVAFRETCDMLEGVQEGDTVLVIGKPAEYNGNKQIVAEVVRRVPPEAELVHKAEVAKLLREHTENVRKAYEIYNELGLTAKAKVKAKAFNIPDQLLENIDKLEELLLSETEFESAAEELFKEE